MQYECRQIETYTYLIHVNICIIVYNLTYLVVTLSIEKIKCWDYQRYLDTKRSVWEGNNRNHFLIQYIYIIIYIYMSIYLYIIFFISVKKNVWYVHIYSKLTTKPRTTYSHSTSRLPQIPTPPVETSGIWWLRPASRPSSWHLESPYSCLPLA